MIDWDTVVHAPVETIFGQPASYRTKQGFSRDIAGVFDEAATDIDVADGAPVTTTHPRFGYRVSDLPIPARQGDFLFIPAAPRAPLVDTLYIIKKVMIDGHGWCYLFLNVAPTSKR